MLSIERLITITFVNYCYLKQPNFIILLNFIITGLFFNSKWRNEKSIEIWWEETRGSVGLFAPNHAFHSWPKALNREISTCATLTIGQHVKFFNFFGCFRHKHRNLAGEGNFVKRAKKSDLHENPSLHKSNSSWKRTVSKERPSSIVTETLKNEILYL